MEPDRNPNVSRTQKQVFYNFTRRYGESLELRRVIESEMDYATGARTRNYVARTIRNAVYIPSTTERSVQYTPAMMQAIRQYAWQGGAGQDIEESGFLIASRDLRNWDEFDPTDRLLWRNRTYELTRVQAFDGGVIIWAKAARSNETDEVITPVEEGVGAWAIEEDFVVS